MNHQYKVLPSKPVTSHLPCDDYTPSTATCWSTWSLNTTTCITSRTSPSKHRNVLGIAISFVVAESILCIVVNCEVNNGRRYRLYSVKNTNKDFHIIHYTIHTVLLNSEPVQCRKLHKRRWSCKHGDISRFQSWLKSLNVNQRSDYGPKNIVPCTCSDDYMTVLPMLNFEFIGGQTFQIWCGF